MSTIRAGLGIAAAIAASVLLSGCAKDEPPQTASPFAGAPFVLIPDAAGGLVARDADGKPLDGPIVQLPLEAKAVKSVSQITLIKIEGSCYYLYCVNGRCTKLPC